MIRARVVIDRSIAIASRFGLIITRRARRSAFHRAVITGRRARARDRNFTELIPSSLLRRSPDSPDGAPVPEQCYTRAPAYESTSGHTYKAIYVVSFVYVYESYLTSSLMADLTHTREHTYTRARGQGHRDNRARRLVASCRSRDRPASRNDGMGLRRMTFVALTRYRVGTPVR